MDAKVEKMFNKSLMNVFSTFQNIPSLLKKIKHAVVAVNKFHLFNHMDFLHGRRVQDVQKTILKVINQFDKDD